METETENWKIIQYLPNLQTVRWLGNTFLKFTSPKIPRHLPLCTKCSTVICTYNLVAQTLCADDFNLLELGRLRIFALCQQLLLLIDSIDRVSDCTTNCLARVQFMFKSTGALFSETAACFAVGHELPWVIAHVVLAQCLHVYSSFPEPDTAPSKINRIAAELLQRVSISSVLHRDGKNRNVCNAHFVAGMRIFLIAYAQDIVFRTVDEHPNSNDFNASIGKYGAIEAAARHYRSAREDLVLVFGNMPFITTLCDHANRLQCLSKIFMATAPGRLTPADQVGLLADARRLLSSMLPATKQSEWHIRLSSIVQQLYDSALLRNLTLAGPIRLPNFDTALLGQFLVPENPKFVDADIRKLFASPLPTTLDNGNAQVDSSSEECVGILRILIATIYGDSNLYDIANTIHTITNRYYDLLALWKAVRCNSTLTTTNAHIQWMLGVVRPSDASIEARMNWINGIAGNLQFLSSSSSSSSSPSPPIVPQTTPLEKLILECAEPRVSVATVAELRNHALALGPSKFELFDVLYADIGAAIAYYTRLNSMLLSKAGTLPITKK